MYIFQIPGAKEGKAVKRKYWGDKEFIKFDPKNLIWRDEKGYFFPKGYGGEAELLADDFEPCQEFTSDAIKILQKRFKNDEEFQKELKKERKLLKVQMKKNKK